MCLAGMIAVLVISHPDHKFKDWIGRLQISWMMTQDPEHLHVEQGFWKGITHKNLHDAFKVAETPARQAQQPLLADYDVLFGPAFKSCRRDIRPHLPIWAQDVSLKEPPSDEDATDHERGKGDAISVEDTSSEDEDAASEEHEKAGDVSNGAAHDGALTAEDLRRAIRGYLVNPIVTGPDQLERWLAEMLASESENAVLLAWCKYWLDRSKQVTSHMEHIITRDLFLQSLRRLYSISQTTTTRECVVADQTTLATAYMLADKDDGELRTFERGGYDDASDQLRHFSEYEALQQANARLARTVTKNMASSTVTRLTRRVSESLTHSLLDLVKGPAFFNHWRGVFLLEAARTNVILHGLENIHDGTDSSMVRWRASRDQLLMDETIESARLTNWQIRSMLLPGPDCEHVLTISQDYLFHNIDNGPQVKRALRLKPARSDLRAMPEGTLSAAADSIRKEYATLFWLFEDVSLIPEPLRTPEIPPISSRRPSGAHSGGSQNHRPDAATQEGTAPTRSSHDMDGSDLSVRGLSEPSLRSSPVRHPGSVSARPTHDTISPDSSSATSKPVGFSVSPSAVNAPVATLPATPTSLATQNTQRIPASLGSTAARRQSSLPYNPFEGQSIPRKRKASPDVERVAKMPVLEFKALLGTERDQQNDAFKSWLKADRESLQADLQYLKNEMRTLQSHLNIDRNTTTQALASTTATHQADLVVMRQGLTSKMDSFRDDLNNLRATFDSGLALREQLLKAGLASHGEMLKTELDTRFASHRGQLKGEVAKLASSIDTKLSSHLDQAEKDTGMQSTTRISQLTTDITTSVAAGLDLKLTSHLDQLKSDVNTTLAAQVQQAREYLDVKLTSQFEQLKRDLTAKAAEAEADKKGRRVGEDGFLSQQCPAPGAWNQQDYEGKLERAAWSYICYFGDVGERERVGPDQAAFEHVGSIFPDLQAHDIVTTLHHIHLRVFRCEFGWEDAEQPQRGRQEFPDGELVLPQFQYDVEGSGNGAMEDVV